MNNDLNIGTIKLVEEKTWWESRTVWSAIVTIICLVATAFGIEVSEDQKSVVIDAFAAIAGSLGVIVGAILSIKYRIKADKTISSQR